MKDYQGITDQSSATRQRYDLVAEHNIQSYSSAMREQNEQKNGADFLLTKVGRAVWYLVFNPALFVLKFALVNVHNYVIKRFKL